MKNRPPFDDNDFIVTWLIGAIFIVCFVLFLLYGYAVVVNAAYDISGLFVSSSQIEQAEKDGAIVRVNLEVVDNYGTQDTWNPQIVGLNK